MCVASYSYIHIPKPLRVICKENPFFTKEHVTTTWFGFVIVNLRAINIPPLRGLFLHQHPKNGMVS